MPQTFPALVAETNALMRVFDAAADCPGVDVTIWEREQPAAVDVLYAWATERQYAVKRRTYYQPVGHEQIVYEVTINTYNTICVYEA